MRTMIVSLMMAMLSAISVCGTEKDTANEMLRKIEEANTAIETLQGNFIHSRVNKDGSHEMYEGMLYVDAENIAMHYDKTDRELFMIEGDKIHMRRKGKTRDVNLKIIKPMNSLKTTILCSMHGKVATLADSQPSYTVNVTTSANEIIVEFRSKKKSAMGYEIIRNTYDSDNYRLKRMEMVEFNGNSNTYTIGPTAAGQHIDPKMFDIDLY